MAWKKVGSFEKLEIIDLTRNGEGTETVGKFVDMRSFKSNYGDKMAHAYVLENDGVKKQFYGNTVLDARMPNIQVGSLIKIVYLGEEPSPKKGQNPYKNFEVYEDDGTGEAEAAPAEAPKKGGKIPF